MTERRRYLVEIPDDWGEKEIETFNEEVEKAIRIIESLRRGLWGAGE